MTKYVEERRIREGCERQRDGMCLCLCVRVCINVCEYGSFTPSRNQGAVRLAGLRCSSLARLLLSRETLGGYAGGGDAEIN